MNKTDRLPWREYAMELAKTASLRSEDPYKKVGACALAEDGKVLALGYNGLASGKTIAPWCKNHSLYMQRLTAYL